MAIEVSPITCFNAVILGASKRRKMDAVGLHGELTDPEMPQPETARAVLKVLNALLGLPQIEELKRKKGAKKASRVVRQQKEFV